MTQPQPQPGILDIQLYVGGKSSVQGVRDILKLSSNENPNGPPASAQQALAEAASTLHRYPSSDHSGLRAALAELHGLEAQRIICGCGSDELISFLCQAYAGPEVEVIHTEHGFLMYRLYAMAAGARLVCVPEAERHVDVEAILSAITPRTGMIFIANPGNPTGTKISDEDLAELIAKTPKTVVIVLDGAYADYVEGWDGGARFVEAHDNVVMLRTLSKMYGLGGLRVGWGYGPQHIIDVLNRVRGPFNISAPALAAGEARCVIMTSSFNIGRKTMRPAPIWPRSSPRWASPLTRLMRISFWPVSPAKSRRKPAMTICKAWAFLCAGWAAMACRSVCASPCRIWRDVRGWCRRCGAFWRKPHEL